LAGVGSARQIIPGEIREEEEKREVDSRISDEYNEEEYKNIS